MFSTDAIEADNKADFYAQLADFARGLVHGETDAIANAANLAALLYHMLPDVNWAGFYFMRPLENGGRELVVGPFNGKPACVRIALGKGVCGTAAETRQTQRVADVDAFPGHIPCDAASRSEVVVPLLRGDEVIGVLDIDSPMPDRFDADDQAGLERIARIAEESLALL
ncbi:MAG: GAF domain-containing protein [Gammaproteobacteria bacterium]|nr:GAF domain-containing protein [Gammaproteobacteria bacterium]